MSMKEDLSDRRVEATRYEDEEGEEEMKTVTLKKERKSVGHACMQSMQSACSTV